MKASRCLILLAIGCIAVPSASTLFAGEREPIPKESPVPSRLREYRSNHLHVRTDLGRDEAEAMYARLEVTLQFASKYWGREPRGQIDCYVVDDLDNWSDAELPHRLARVIIFGVGGATVPKSVVTGNRIRNLPTVFASSKPGVAEHEVIHAYCTQTFGSTGPEWYKEGMAEMVVRRCTRKSGVKCSREHFTTLQAGKRMTVQEILAVGGTGRRISVALKAMLTDPAHDGGHVSSAAWTQGDSDNVSQARDEYLRSWALCYMLLHNPNYSKRFRTVGQLLVADRRGAFEELFDPVRAEIAFEYEFLLEHMSDGYRVDLCRWDWRTRFRPLDGGQTHHSRVAAARGFQASGAEVVAGQQYSYEADGRWSTHSDSGSTDADGRADDSGRLVGVVLNGFKLGKPFTLGVRGTFEAPSTGRLYLRCGDAWNEVGDNEGKIVVRFTSASR